MEPSVYGLFLLIIIILIGSACCSGVEAAFLAVNSIRILEIASRQKPKSSANQLLKLRKHLGRTLTVITITNNGFNIIGSLILGVYGALIINNSFGLTLFSIAFYILVVLVGEVLPKALGTRFSVQIALLSVPILRILNILMRPFLILIEQIFPVITAENEISTDEEEIRQMAKIGSQKGLIEADEAAMIFKVFQLNDLKANLILRGLRAMSDFEYELQIAHTNKSLNNDIETIFLSTNTNYSFLSSSLVKEVAKFGGEINHMVPPSVERDLKEYFK